MFGFGKKKNKGKGKGQSTTQTLDTESGSQSNQDVMSGLGLGLGGVGVGLGLTDTPLLDMLGGLGGFGLGTDDGPELIDFSEGDDQGFTDLDEDDEMELYDFEDGGILDDDVGDEESDDGKPRRFTRKNARKELSEENVTERTEVGRIRRKLAKAEEHEKKGDIKKYSKKEEKTIGKALRDLELGEQDLAMLGNAKWPENPFDLDMDRRLKNGPLLTDAELGAIDALSTTDGGRKWLSCAGLFTRDRAYAFLGGKFYEWLLLEPATRVQLATIAWKEGLGRDPATPAYSLGRHFALRTSEDPIEKTEAELERDMDVRTRFRETMIPRDNNELTTEAIEDGAILSPTEGKSGVVKKAIKPKFMGKSKETDPEQVKLENDQAIGILEKVFLLLQAGLQIYDEDLGRHVDLEGVDVCRALAHGGRVNVRIPAITGGETGHELTDWLGLTEDGHGAGGAVFARGFGTHHMKIGENTEDGLGDFVEEGSTGAAIRNVFEGTKMWGMNLSSGGFGTLDHNGDVVLPDGGHGHMFFGFTAPTTDTDGALQIGMETTMPGGPSMVGYVHDSSSTEATANPESSFGGHKSDKIGDGSPREVVTKNKLGTKGRDYDSWESTNARFVDLRSVGQDGDQGQEQGGDGGWLAYLEELRTGWFEPLKEQDRSGALDQLLGPRQA